MRMTVPPQRPHPANNRATREGPSGAESPGAPRPAGILRPYLIGPPIMRVSTFLPTLRARTPAGRRIVGDLLKSGGRTLGSSSGRRVHDKPIFSHLRHRIRCRVHRRLVNPYGGLVV